MNNSQEWKDLLRVTMALGDLINPRGLPTKEMLGRQTRWDMMNPVIFNSERRLSYKFMHAEAYWILSGRCDVPFMAKHSNRIRDYSDSGMHYFGAYGPKFVQQLEYIYKTLANDLWSRQAVLNIWRESPMSSKDIPCTISLQFIIRKHKLHTIATMRSSDIFMGVPYDVFNFSMMSWYVCLMFKEHYPHLRPGTLTLTAGSQHYYMTDEAKIRVCEQMGDIKPDYEPILYEEIGDIHDLLTKLHTRQE
jgi:thymidylate synthase